MTDSCCARTASHAQEKWLRYEVAKDWSTKDDGALPFKLFRATRSPIGSPQPWREWLASSSAACCFSSP